MDATPDLKRLAPVENLAIDVISYAHGSVTPTLTNLYSKGKESFLKVYKIFFSITGAFLSSSSSSLVNENFFSSFSRRTNERTNRMILSEIVVDDAPLSFDLWSFAHARKFRKHFPFFLITFRKSEDEPSSSSSSSLWRRWSKILFKHIHICRTRTRVTDAFETNT